MRRLGPQLLLALALFLGVGSAHAEPDRTLRLERIEVLPASTGLEAAIGDLLGLHPGDAVDAETLRAARRKLQLSGWFDSVQVYTARGSGPGRLVLKVDADLDRGVRFQTGFAHDPLLGWALKLAGLRADHVFRPADSIALGLQVGLRHTTLEADFVTRRFAGFPFDLLVHAEAGNEDWNAFVGDDFYQQRVGRGALDLGTRWHHGEGLSTTLWLGASGANPRGVYQLEGIIRDPPSDLLGPPRDREAYYDLGLDFTLDRRDLAQPWRKGSWSTLRLRGSHIAGGDEFGLVRGAVRAAMPLPGESALAWRLDGTWSNPTTPYHLRPIFGGQGTVRGFREGSLSGGEGARAIVATALELRVPLLPRQNGDARVHGALFVDTGTWIDAGGGSHDWATSVGWGVRVRVPWIERLSIDMATPLTPPVTNDPFWVHAGLGFGF